MNFNVVESVVHIPLIWWFGTLVWFIILLSVDLFFHQKEKDVSIKSSIINTLIWLGLASLLGLVIWLRFGSGAGVKFFSGYLIEQTLSIDNIFVWGLILSYFAIPRKLHYKALFYGIFGAIIFRTIFVFVGLELIDNFQITLLVLGLLVIVSGIRLLINNKKRKFNPGQSKLIRFIDWVLPVSKRLEGDKLIIKERGKYYMSLLFFVIVVIEIIDILFAMDSVPAVIAIVRDPYIVLASNISAILGLRSLYFIFEALKNKFWLLHKGVSIILLGIGIKLLIEPSHIFNLNWLNINISTNITLIFILIIISASVIGSLYFKKGTSIKV